MAFDVPSKRSSMDVARQHEWNTLRTEAKGLAEPWSAYGALKSNDFSI